MPEDRVTSAETIVRSAQMTAASNLLPIPELYVSADSAAKLKVEAGDLPSWDLTPRQICDLELLMNGALPPAQGLPVEGRLRVGLRRHAARRRHALADADHPRRLRGLRRQGRARAGHRAARPGGGDPRDHVGQRQVVARQEPRGRAGVRRRRHRPPGGQLPAPQGRPGLSRRADHRHPAAGALRLPRPAQHPERAPHLSSASSAGGGSSRSRPATRCTGRTRS